MKRTYEQSLTFFKRNTKNRGEERELYLTPKPLIRSIVKSLLENKPELKEYKWVDPCAGDGRWQEVIKDFGLKCASLDIKPLNVSVVKQDFFKLSPEGDTSKVFFIGNPPFSMVKQFVDKALSISGYCYFLGGSALITGKLAHKVEILHRFEGFEGNQKDKRSKAKFIDTLNKEVLIWCCGALFSKKEQKRFERDKESKQNYFRVAVKCFCKEDLRVKKITTIIQ